MTDYSGNFVGDATVKGQILTLIVNEIQSLTTDMADTTHNCNFHQVLTSQVVVSSINASLSGHVGLRKTLAGNVGFLNVEKMVELTDMCVSARHVANMSADMSETQPKMVSAEVLTMSSQHVAYGYVGNMLAL